PNVGFGPIFAAAGHGPPSSTARTAYTPSPGSTVGTSARFAVGNPIVRPRRAPATTAPAIRYGRPSNSAASPTSPDSSADRTRLLDTGSPPTTSGGTSSNPIPAAAHSSR